MSAVLLWYLLWCPALVSIGSFPAVHLVYIVFGCDIRVMSTLLYMKVSTGRALEGGLGGAMGPARWVDEW